MSTSSPSPPPPPPPTLTASLSLGPRLGSRFVDGLCKRRRLAPTNAYAGILNHAVAKPPLLATTLSYHQHLMLLPHQNASKANTPTSGFSPSYGGVSMSVCRREWTSMVRETSMRRTGCFQSGSGRISSSVGTRQGMKSTKMSFRRRSLSLQRPFGERIAP